MTYLMMQMLLCLLIAFLLGFLLGWWLGRRALKERLERSEVKWRQKLDGCRNELSACRVERDTCGEERALGRQELGSCRQELEGCRKDLAAAAGRAEVLAASPLSHADPLLAPVTLADLPADASPDDLKRVEGIGPKIEGLLNDRGIMTWKQLAAAEESFLQSVLDDAGPRYRIHDPGTWPQQAALAAAGSWDELEQLQNRLKGGRKA